MRYGDSRTCRETWQMMRCNPFYMLQKMFGVAPPAGWAQICMEGDRAAALRPVRAAFAEPPLPHAVVVQVQYCHVRGQALRQGAYAAGY